MLVKRNSGGGKGRENGGPGSMKHGIGGGKSGFVRLHNTSSQYHRLFRSRGPHSNIRDRLLTGLKSAFLLVN